MLEEQSARSVPIQSENGQPAPAVLDKPVDLNVTVDAPRPVLSDSAVDAHLAATTDQTRSVLFRGGVLENSLSQTFGSARESRPTFTHLSYEVASSLLQQTGILSHMQLRIEQLASGSSISQDQMRQWLTEELTNNPRARALLTRYQWTPAAIAEGMISILFRGQSPTLSFETEDGRLVFVVARVGEGSFGKVRLALSEGSDEPVVVKFMQRGDREKDMWLEAYVRAEREGSLHADAGSGGPVLLAAGKFSPSGKRREETEDTLEERLPYVMMKHRPGVTLGALIRAGGGRRFAPGFVKYLGLRIACAMCELHKSVVHRDTKPENIFLHDDLHTAKLLDYGSACPVHKQEGEQYTATGMIIGTPQYMPPQQLGRSKDAKPWFDVHALARCLYLMSTGEQFAAAHEVTSLFTSIGQEIPVTDLNERQKDRLKALAIEDKELAALLRDALYKQGMTATQFADRLLKMVHGKRYASLERYIEQPAEETGLGISPPAVPENHHPFPSAHGKTPEEAARNIYAALCEKFPSVPPLKPFTPRKPRGKELLYAAGGAVLTLAAGIALLVSGVLNRPGADDETKRREREPVSSLVKKDKPGPDTKVEAPAPLKPALSFRFKPGPNGGFDIRDKDDNILVIRKTKDMIVGYKDGQELFSFFPAEAAEIRALLKPVAPDTDASFIDRQWCTIFKPQVGKLLVDVKAGVIHIDPAKKPDFVGRESLRTKRGDGIRAFLKFPGTSPPPDDKPLVDEVKYANEKYYGPPKEKAADYRKQADILYRYLLGHLVKEEKIPKNENGKE